MYRNIAVLIVAAQAFTVPAFSQIAKAVCTKVGPARYRIEFAPSRDIHSIQILVSSKPDLSDATLAVNASSSPVEVDAGKPGQRMYFLLKPDHGAAVEVSFRHLPLEGARNVRDLGGYTTVNGSTVKWGSLYRADELGHLTDTDLTYLEQLQVKVVTDFRSADERTRLADRWPATPVAVNDWNPLDPIAGGDGKSMQAFQRQLFANPDPANVRQLMVDIYRHLAIDGAPAFRATFQTLLNNGTPMVYHCTAGKDRTGLFSAFVLLTLGVPRDVVTEDYLLSNQYTLSPEAINRMTRMLSAAPNAPTLSPEAARALLGVDKEYLDAALAAIDLKYGSFDQYRREALGVSDAEAEQLRAGLLTP